MEGLRRDLSLCTDHGPGLGRDKTPQEIALVSLFSLSTYLLSNVSVVILISEIIVSTYYLLVFVFFPIGVKPRLVMAPSWGTDSPKSNTTYKARQTTTS